jgi:SAM-dependent methyltransferase
VTDTPKPERLYRGAAAYYARYRPPYPAALVPLLARTFDLDGTGRLLDLGCGPGPVAIRLAHLFQHVVGMDPEPDMLREGAIEAGRAGVTNIEWVEGSSETLSPSHGPYRLVTMGESFHWMDRPRTLAALYDLIDVGGGIAIVGRGAPLPLPPMTPWRAAVARVLRDYLGDVLLPWDRPPIADEERHQVVVRRSPFTEVAEHNELFEVEWNLDSMLGNLYSMSFCNRDRLGERAEPFERDIRSAVLAVEPSGRFRGEQHEFFALTAFKRASQSG